MSKSSNIVYFLEIHFFKIQFFGDNSSVWILKSHVTQDRDGLNKIIGLVVWARDEKSFWQETII